MLKCLKRAKHTWRAQDGGRIFMGKSYDKTRRYSERDALLLSLEMQSEILLEFKKLNKLLKVGEAMKRKPKQPSIKK